MIADRLSWSFCGHGQVREWYVLSYEEIRDFPRPVTVDEEIKFAELLQVSIQNTFRPAPLDSTAAARLFSRIDLF